MNTRFHLGETVVTTDARAALRRADQLAAVFLDRHIGCDWGLVDPDTARQNDQAIDPNTGHYGEVVQSMYETAAGDRVCVVTDPSRSATTVCIPEECISVGGEAITDDADNFDGDATGEGLFLIVSSDGEQQTPIIDADDGKGSHFLFSSAKAADAYLHAMEWNNDYEVGMIATGDLLTWFVDLRSGEIAYLFIDPDPSEGPQQAVVLEELLGELQTSLMEMLMATEGAERV